MEPLASGSVPTSKRNTAVDFSHSSSSWVCFVFIILLNVHICTCLDGWQAGWWAGWQAGGLVGLIAGLIALFIVVSVSWSIEPLWNADN